MNRGNRGVIFVHGVGTQRKSDTLLDLGNPLLGWLQRWFTAFGGAVRTGRVELSFSPVDVGPGDAPVTGCLHLPGRRWVLAEVWWAGSERPPGLATMLWWSLRHLGDIVMQLFRNTGERVARLIHPDPAHHPTQPAAWWQLVDLVNCLGLLVLYPTLAFVGYVLLVPLIVLAQIPIQSVQTFVLLRLITPLLTINAGEFRTMLDDELQAANIRRRLADTIDGMVKRQACDDLTLIAHSEGAVVSFGMLVDPEFAVQALHVRKVITLGAGLNKSWLLAPHLQRLHGPLDGNIQWTDVWASFDPVPAGPLSPPQGVTIYAPHGTPQPPVDLQVTNGMNVLTDHGGYWSNDEQVMVRLAAEIDADDYTASLFWVGDWDAAARRRRERVSVIALVRAIAVVGALVSIGATWLDLKGAGVAPWTSLTDLPFVPGWLSTPVTILRWLQVILAAVLPPAAGLVQQVLALPAYALAALILAVCWWAVYSLIHWSWWDRWDRCARDAAIRSSAEQARGRVVQNTPRTPCRPGPTAEVQ